MHITWYLGTQLIDDADGSADLQTLVDASVPRWIGGAFNHVDPGAHLRWVSSVLERYPEAAATAKATTSGQTTLVWLRLGGPRAQAGDIDSEDAVRAEAERQISAGAELPENDVQQVMEVCCGSPIPAGWIKVNDRWDPTRCGNPTSIVYNVCVIARYDDKPVGHVMEVCAGAPTPAGWVVTDTRWDPTRCGHPSNIVQNMKRIRRVS